jgi:hypothetical protein
MARFPILNRYLPAVMMGAMKTRRKTPASAKGSASRIAWRPKRPAAQRRTGALTEIIPGSGPDVPYWIPRGSGWQSLSDATREAVTQNSRCEK